MCSIPWPGFPTPYFFTCSSDTPYFSKTEMRHSAFHFVDHTVQVLAWGSDLGKPRLLPSECEFILVLIMCTGKLQELPHIWRDSDKPCTQRITQGVIHPFTHSLHWGPNMLGTRFCVISLRKSCSINITEFNLFNIL